MNEPREYVDVRGVWPIYIKGQVGIQLIGKPRDISVEDARDVAEELMAGGVQPNPVNK